MRCPFPPVSHVPSCDGSQTCARGSCFSWVRKNAHPDDGLCAHRGICVNAQGRSGETSGKSSGRRQDGHRPPCAVSSGGFACAVPEPGRPGDSGKGVSATCCWATADLCSLFTGVGPGGSPSTPTMSALATLSPRPPAPTTVSSRACPATLTACPSPTAACECPPLGRILCRSQQGPVFLGNVVRPPS